MIEEYCVKEYNLVLDRQHIFEDDADDTKENIHLNFINS